MHAEQYFRAGVGSVIYNSAGEVLIFSRANNPAIWQFQQGGMDTGETVEDTLWRELYEETALTRKDFLTITPYPKWTVYEYPDAIKHHNRLGQAHRWFFLALHAATEIDLTKAADKEFSDYRFIPFADFVHTNHEFKSEVYAELYHYYTRHIDPQQKAPK